MSSPHNNHPPGEPVDYRDFQTDPSLAGAIGAHPGPATADTPQKNPAALWALILALIAVLAGLTVLGATFSFIIGFISLLLAIAALIRAGKITPGQPGRRLGMAWTAVILSTFAILLSLFFYLLLFFLYHVTGLEDCLYLPTYQERYTCLEGVLNNG